MRIASACLLIALAAPLGWSYVLADSALFRCSAEDGSVIFADHPCDDTSTAYQFQGSLSVVSTPDNLDAHIRANQQFLQRRRDQLEQARRMRRERQLQREPDPQPAVPASARTFVPYWAPGYTRSRPPPGPVDRSQPEREQRFSALSGRFPGSARRPERGQRD